MDRLMYLLQRLAFRDGIPVHKMNAGGEIEYSLEWAETENPFLTDSDWAKHIISLWNEKMVPLVVEEAQRIFCGVIGAEDGSCYFWGPVCEDLLTGSALKRYKDSHGISSADFQMKKASLFAIKCDMEIFYLMLSGQALSDIDIYKVSTEQKITAALRENEIEQYRFYTSENDTVRISYKLEQDIKEAIRTGNDDFLKSLSIGIASERAGRLAKSEKRHQEYTAVSGITMASRAAIEGGLSPSEALILSDLYLQRLKNCKNTVEITSLLYNAILDFVARVQLARENRNKNAYIEQCKNYIASSIYRPVRVEEIAHAIGLNRSYLSKKFRETEGISMQDYITAEKIRVAKDLLRYSETGIAEIAERLCFNSQSSFGAVFKKNTGMMPTEYRNKYMVSEILT